MGMYTQVRGWLNVDSIGFNGEEKLERQLMEAKESFKRSAKCDRKWVCEDTILHIGGNGSAYLFFGTELKNYDRAAEEWIEHLLTFFDNAEGRIDFQYEEECVGGEDYGTGIVNDKSTYWEIYQGKVTKIDKCDCWCEGYGNCSKLTHDR